ncbi:hypothetical protein [Janibacter cremeus]|uniref:Uncharacterized protein n=1 Tax=Janibacter cremeus TaxID=1285192 RepID=A0A852VQI1_9MICO|nr:hypothetical protein [Janibacter cremeus]NYF99212.1 hypothetical protein [Janibacter cremeus]
MKRSEQLEAEFLALDSDAAKWNAARTEVWSAEMSLKSTRSKAPQWADMPDIADSRERGAVERLEAARAHLSTLRTPAETLMRRMALINAIYEAEERA